MHTMHLMSMINMMAKATTTHFQLLFPLLVCFALICASPSSFPKEKGLNFDLLKGTQLQSSGLKASGGGIPCAACTIITSLLEQLSVIHDKPIEDVVAEICDYFTPEFQQLCTYLVDEYGQDVIKLITQDLNADEVCHGLELCTDPTCLMYPQTGRKMQVLPHRAGGKMKNPQWNPWDWIQSLIQAISDHKPIVDVDGDLHSVEPVLRGSNWRGKDCNDLDSNSYPGRNSDADPYTDSNCNGIYGVDPSGKSYEELFCKNSGQIGVVLLGDSAGAHFSIPESYMNASEIDKNTYLNLLDVLSNEIDWPQYSGITGFESNPNFPTDSLYQTLLQRNRCNHRDYQNIGVNGARSGAMSRDIVTALQRNQTLDNPVLLILELIGNDVCSGHHDFDHMTKVDEFRNNTLKTLTYLDSILPKGSHVVFIGLADGLVLYDVLHNRTHPIGVTYEVVYDYLNCLDISPCWVWMNSNQTVRETGQKRADELSAVYSQIIASYNFTNFDMAYYDFPFKQINDIWTSKGGQTYQLIEPIDGFHPGQIANSLLADVLWTMLSQDHPNFLGPVNPHNDEIQKIFGDQGGY